MKLFLISILFCFSSVSGQVRFINSNDMKTITITGLNPPLLGIFNDTIRRTYQPNPNPLSQSPVLKPALGSALPLTSRTLWFDHPWTQSRPRPRQQEALCHWTRSSKQCPQDQCNLFSNNRRLLRHFHFRRSFRTLHRMWRSEELFQGLQIAARLRPWSARILKSNSPLPPISMIAMDSCSLRILQFQVQVKVFFEFHNKIVEYANLLKFDLITCLKGSIFNTRHANCNVKWAQ